jgi:uncharacterized protein (DUF1684 family)
MKTFIRAAIVLPFFIVSSYAHAQNTDKSALEDIQKHRDEQNKEFGDPEKSPLGKKEAKKFKGLNYYSPELKYRVTAKFIKNEKPVLFKMKTSTSRLPDYSKYGELVFMIDSVEYKLEVYQSPDIVKMEGYADYLFVPFTDLSNGEGSYEGGRYIDLRVPETDEVILDFNKSYNPYCSYSPNYSCPVPPEVNHLPIAIHAGEKTYGKGH